jgi:hypothetical protein
MRTRLRPAIGVDQATINRWLGDAKSNSLENASPPESRQHFDIWQFHDGGGRTEYKSLTR